MVTRVQPGASVGDRISLYRRLSSLGVVRENYAAKFALAALVGVMIPLAVFIVYLMLSRTDLATMYPALAALVLACFAGFLGTMWMVRELLVPIDLTAEALRAYIDSRKLPDLPAIYLDRAGRLMEGTQYTLAQLHETINRLERVSDSDELTGVYNRRAGEKRLAEECARAERDLQSFHLAFFDINAFKQVNDRHGHSAGDACISHMAALLQLNTRRGDWVARWGGDEFVVGLHRNRALKMVMERIVKAISTSPCEISPGLELRLSVSCGVAEYRFGSGAAGVLADADKAMYLAKEVAHRDGSSQVRYRGELEEGAAREPAATAGVDA
jgi:diguanylate cyclase (GGDEF)-like protein